MCERNKRTTSFTEGKILQPLVLFALPVLFALFLQAMYGAVDLLIVGKFASSADESCQKIPGSEDQSEDRVLPDV